MELAPKRGRGRPVSRSKRGGGAERQGLVTRGGFRRGWMDEDQHGEKWHKQDGEKSIQCDKDFNYAGGSDEAGGRSVQLLQPSILIGQEVQLSSCCLIRILHPTSINALIG